MSRFFSWALSLGCRAGNSPPANPGEQITYGGIGVTFDDEALTFTP